MPAKRALVEPAHEHLAVTRQCALLGLSHSSLYYTPSEAPEEDLALMRRIDAQYLDTPFYGVRRMTAQLRTSGLTVNPKRVRRLMRLMRLEAIGPKARLSERGPESHVFPYLLRNLAVTRPNQVWATDITYIPLRQGFAYLMAILDWHSRYVVTWELSTTLEAEFCVQALHRALRVARPEIMNSDQGSQFTSAAWTQTLQDAGVKISMDGRGRALDNVFIERLWRSVKYEDVYPRDYASVSEARRGLGRYFGFYNKRRLHQALGYCAPASVYAVVA